MISRTDSEARAAGLMLLNITAHFAMSLLVRIDDERRAG
jgi:hypothetical protein